MTIIQIEPLETGQHPIQSQSGRSACWLDDSAGGTDGGDPR